MNSFCFVNLWLFFVLCVLFLVIVLLFGVLVFVVGSGEVLKNFGLDVKIIGELENDCDFGIVFGGIFNDIGIDLWFWVFGQWGDWSVYFMGQVVVVIDIIEIDIL